MSFLPIAITAYILNGFSLTIDKILVTQSLKNPFVYTFYIGILSLLALLLIPFGFTLPSPYVSLIAATSGIVFTFALLSMFASLKYYDLTVASPLIGTLNPISALFLGLIITGQSLTLPQQQSFLFLIAGGVLLTYKLWWGKHSLDRRLLVTLASGFLFGLSYVLLREAFLLSSFIPVMVISRVAMAAVVLVFLFFPTVRQQIFASKLTRAHFTNHILTLVFISQGVGALSGLMLTFAVSLANPAVVNSLYGLQYFILLGAAYWLSKKDVHILHEHISNKNGWQKVLATILIALGLYYLMQ